MYQRALFNHITLYALGVLPTTAVKTDLDVFGISSNEEQNGSRSFLTLGKPKSGKRTLKHFFKRKQQHNEPVLCLPASDNQCMSVPNGSKTNNTALTIKPEKTQQPANSLQNKKKFGCKLLKLRRSTKGSSLLGNTKPDNAITSKVNNETEKKNGQLCKVASSTKRSLFYGRPLPAIPMENSYVSSPMHYDYLVTDDLEKTDNYVTLDPTPCIVPTRYENVYGPRLEDSSQQGSDSILQQSSGNRTPKLRKKVSSCNNSKQDTDNTYAKLIPSNLKEIYETIDDVKPKNFSLCSFNFQFPVPTESSQPQKAQWSMIGKIPAGHIQPVPHLNTVMDTNQGQEPQQCLNQQSQTRQLNQTKTSSIVVGKSSQSRIPTKVEPMYANIPYRKGSQQFGPITRRGSSVQDKLYDIPKPQIPLYDVPNAVSLYDIPRRSSRRVDVTEPSAVSSTPVMSQLNPRQHNVNLTPVMSQVNPRQHNVNLTPTTTHRVLNQTNNAVSVTSSSIPKKQSLYTEFNPIPKNAKDYQVVQYKVPKLKFELTKKRPVQNNNITAVIERLRGNGLSTEW